MWALRRRFNRRYANFRQFLSSPEGPGSIGAAVFLILLITLVTYRIHHHSSLPPKHPRRPLIKGEHEQVPVPWTLPKERRPCVFDAERFYEEAISRLRASDVKLVLIETPDLMSPRDVAARFVSSDTDVSRFGVWFSDYSKLKYALKSTFNCNNGANVTEFFQHGAVVSVAVVARKNEENVALRFTNGEGLPALPFFHWKRIYFRIYHQGGRSHNDHRWTGREDDDDGNYKIPAEIFYDFPLVPAIDGDALFYRPFDVNLFVWRKSSSAYERCIPKSNCVGDCEGKPAENLVVRHMNSISAVTHLMAEFRVLSVLNGAQLLGWWRRCTLQKHEKNVRLLHWSSFDLYPSIVRRILQRRDLFRLRDVFIDPGPETPGLKIMVDVIDGSPTELYFVYQHKVYDTRFEKGNLDHIVYGWPICSAVLHGHLVYVPCSEDKIEEILLMEFGNNYLNHI